MPIVLRNSKNSALTHSELDGNFTDLDTRVNSKADSSTITSIVNTEYIRARQIDLQRDSAFITNIVSETYVTNFIDSAYIQARQVDLQRDSAFVTDIVDSAYVQTLQNTYNNTSVDNHLNVPTASSGQVLSWTGADYDWINQTSGTGGNISLADNEKITFGDDDDLEIFHNSSNGNTIIENTGNLVIKGSNLFLQSATSEYFFRGVANGAVTLYYDDSAKFETTADGISVTDHIALADNGELRLGTDNDMQISHSGVSGLIKSTTGSLVLQGSTVRIQDGGSAQTAFSASNGIATLLFENSAKLATTTDGVAVTGKITGLTDPTAAQDAATKAYVDANSGGGGGGLDSAGIASYLNGGWDFHLIPDTNATYDIGSAEYKVRHLYLSDNSLFFDSGQTSIGFETVGTSKNLKFNNNVVKEASHTEEAAGPVDISKTNHFVTTGATYDLPNGEYVGQELKFWHKTQGGTNIVRVNVLNAKWRNGGGVLSTIPNMLWDQDKENTACYGCIWDGEAWIIGEGSLGA